MSLDMSVILLEPLAILPTLARYVALRKVNESYALLAGVGGRGSPRLEHHSSLG